VNLFATSVWKILCGTGQNIKNKQLVTEAPVLKYFEPKEEFTLQSDASDTGLGAVLTQNGQPIAFASRAFSDAETRHV